MFFCFNQLVETGFGGHLELAEEQFPRLELRGYAKHSFQFDIQQSPSWDSGTWDLSRVLSSHYFACLAERTDKLSMSPIPTSWAPL